MAAIDGQDMRRTLTVVAVEKIFNCAERGQYELVWDRLSKETRGILARRADGVKARDIAERDWKDLHGIERTAITSAVRSMLLFLGSAGLDHYNARVERTKAAREAAGVTA